MQIVVAGLVGIVVGAMFGQGLIDAIALLFVSATLLAMTVGVVALLGYCVLSEGTIDMIQKVINDKVKGWFE